MLLRRLLPTRRHFHTSSTLLGTHYETLGVSRSATSKEIKAAYFAAAKKCHPDVAGGTSTTAKSRFQEISAAYAVLSDRNLRQDYDLSLGEEEHVFKGDCFREESAESIFRAAFGVNFDQMFESRFGWNVEEDNIREYIMGISMMEAVMGAAKYIEVNGSHRCLTCQGYGSPEGKSGQRVDCARCYGSGDVVLGRDQSLTWMMPPDWKENQPDFGTCPDCKGRGWRITKACMECMGKGRMDYIQWHPVSVPPGVKHGQVLNCPGIDGAPMMIVIHIHKNNEFWYDENENVKSRIEVHYATLVEGGHVAVKTIDYEERILEIPPGTKPGTLLELEMEDMGLHVYEVGLYMPNSETIGAHLYEQYRVVQKEEELCVGSNSTPENYAKTLHLNEISRLRLFRNDLFQYTVVPVYRLFLYWPVSTLYSVLRNSKRFGPKLRDLEVSGHYSHWFEKRKKDAVMG